MLLPGLHLGAFVVWLTRILGSYGFGREAMGMGDVHLMFGVGAILGAGMTSVAFFLAPLPGLLIHVQSFAFPRGLPREADLVFDVRFLDNPDSDVSLHRSKAVGEPPLLLGLSAWLAVKDALRYADPRAAADALGKPAPAAARTTGHVSHR